MRPDIITTLPDDQLILPRDVAANPDVLPKPFGRYARFLVRTGLVVKQRTDRKWSITTTMDIWPLVAWLAELPPSSAMIMADARFNVRAVHRAAPGFEDAAERVMVLSAMTGSSRVFLAGSDRVGVPSRDGELVQALLDAEDRANCAPVSVVDSFAIGREGYRAKYDDWASRTRPGGVWNASQMLRAIEEDFDAKCVLARSKAWTGRPGPVFSRKLVEEACEHMKADDQEMMVGLSFDDDLRLVAIYEAARGVEGHVAIGSRDLLKVPILTDARLLAIVHNHPSGVTSPSPDDMTMAQSLESQAACVGVELLGSFIVGRDMKMTKAWP
jgi:hypothetical protein